MEPQRDREFSGCVVMKGAGLMKLYTYLNYGGNCQQAFRFYEQQLGGKITAMMTHAQQPHAENVPPEWKDAILHARLNIGGTELLASDVPPDRFEPMRSTYLHSASKAAKRPNGYIPCSPMAARSSCRWRRPFLRIALECLGTSSGHTG